MGEGANDASGADDVSGLVRCFGCAGLVPDIDGPTHAYLAASPGCWQRYGELLVMDHAGADLSAVPAHVDCYAAQHPGGARHDRRQRQSVAIHLVALCLMLEHRLPATAALAARSRLNKVVLPRTGTADWPYLEPPTTPAGLTVVDVYADAMRGDYPASATRWGDAVWAAWSDHHSTIRRWSEIMRASL